MSELNGSSVFDGLIRELDRWQAEGIEAAIWWRDDDAVDPSPALDRLLAIGRQFDCPVLIAVIPVRATEALAAQLAEYDLVTACQHGYVHRNHALPHAKKTELIDTGPARSVDQVIHELRQGRQRLQKLFGSRLSTILVPPWNRMSDGVAARVHEAGAGALSGFGWGHFASALPQLNTHVDLIDWRGGRGGKAAAVVAAETTAALQAARDRHSRHIGLLTHHLVHDEAAWHALAAILQVLTAHPAAHLVSASSLIRDTSTKDAQSDQTRR